ncbi:hypothetical protein PUNSTDRAFT_19582, partial [Punctularia strigosozonata HHB-11173 SS5]
PFGGCHIIFAGDFAQLQPPGQGTPLWTDVLDNESPKVKQTVNKEKAKFGRALWLLVTNVVILRKNMRQQGMCEEDIKFRTALENLRYKACTQEDITLLKSRVAGPLPHQPKLSDPIYRGVPIITARNVHRDKINEMGAARFALDTGQELICFNSKDKWARPHEKTLDLIRSHNIVDPAIQKMLWDLPPCCTDNHAGSLSLCIGMPVMLKYNEATELCATNGAEATVVGWLEALSEDGHRYLDTLFIRLQNPPRVQHLPGLPENVIPIVPSSKTITCDTQAAKKPRIERKQVPILLNFAMTDFCSQGRTRP